KIQFRRGSRHENQSVPPRLTPCRAFLHHPANGISLVLPSGKPMTIDPLNTELARQEVYSKLTQKQITSWAHIRNKAAHGEFAEYNKEQVQMMLLFVQGFAAEHFG
ncbi:hypothetical protein, partial [Aromatoleum tolulyticum]|uniref:hypothetical protein n=1 Tax=Aromatoleum tolulyticum TaxID=34027 RepID=UPI001BAF032B